jgi:hypothetical protein
VQSFGLSLLLSVLLGPSVLAECHCLSGCLIKAVDSPKGMHIDKAPLYIDTISTRLLTDITDANQSSRFPIAQ